MNTVALLLAAGQGSRLGSLTREKPKCLVTVNGTPILGKIVEGLAAQGISDLFIVCGYLDNVLREFCWAHYPHMRIRYVHNADYASTNSMFSLRLGLEFLADTQKDVLVLESDIFFDAEILCSAPSPGLTWFGDSGYRLSGGSYMACDNGGRITDIRIIRDMAQIQDGMLKSAGIFHVRSAIVPDLLRCLRQGVAKGQANLYYDLVFAENLAEIPMHVHDVRPQRWMEIDTPEDLALAERMFA